ncbi:LmbE family N-acetylglucosaminyl deacetylase [Herbihabitans rhizosphaerae]|uniref:LmbE family N-acetylglucosaminyl deacetylase n=1 Tax=Herbihabitans rhizosphaerae TaxID=1872711 RepID=A0A4Q7KW09_9PSEU|nr:PIG-L family deacetylase [Herbihabitans rhizosphaerae]RZS40934.1 LmbE family N-acetylglucosaminyl deacetylase [Herbihabitans rhizosphaerae]
MGRVLSLIPGPVRRLAVLGAHCDDVAIGAGGTLLDLCRRMPGVRVEALVLTGGGTGREAEERAALGKFCPGAELNVRVLELPDGWVTGHWAAAKEAVEDLRAVIDPDLVIGPAKCDAHADHRTLAGIVPSAFRDHLTLGYEIVKWEGDLGQPSAYYPLTGDLVREKSDLLHEHYPSQAAKPWFDGETFLGLARVRGVQCRARYAEAFYVDKVVIGAPPRD